VDFTAQLKHHKRDAIHWNPNSAQARNDRSLSPESSAIS